MTTTTRKITAVVNLPKIDCEVSYVRLKDDTCLHDEMYELQGKRLTFTALKMDDRYQFKSEDGWLFKRSWLKDIVEEESVVDWTNVKVDTKILVRDEENGAWRASYFSKYSLGKVYAWACGTTSWSTSGKDSYWNFAKLAEEESYE